MAKKLLITGVAYYVWMERNGRAFSNPRREPWQVLKRDILADVWRKM